MIKSRITRTPCRARRIHISEIEIDNVRRVLPRTGTKFGNRNSAGKNLDNKHSQISDWGWLFAPTIRRPNAHDQAYTTVVVRQASLVPIFNEMGLERVVRRLLGDPMYEHVDFGGKRPPRFLRSISSASIEAAWSESEFATMTFRLLPNSFTYSQSASST